MDQVVIGGGDSKPMDEGVGSATSCATSGATSSTSGPSRGGEGGPTKPAAAAKRKSSEAARRKSSTGVKRKSGTPAATKPKKARKKARFGAGPGYTVQEGEDMLLLISNTGHQDHLAWRPLKKKKKMTTAAKKKTTSSGKGKLKTHAQRKKKKPAATKPGVNLGAPTLRERSNGVAEESPLRAPKDLDHRWGQSLPEEVLVSIFQMIVVQDGAIPFLCRVSRVCRLWNTAAASPGLWRSVSMGFCWITPSKTQTPRTEEKIKNTIGWLASDRFSQLKEFTLNHWKKNVDYAVKVVSQSCPQLASLNLSYCTGVTGQAFLSLAENSPSLQSINMQYSEYQVEGLAQLLKTNGGKIRKFLFTHGSRNDMLLAALSRGCCPDLEFLEINWNVQKGGFCELPIHIQALQHGCPKLKTFRLLNVVLGRKTIRNAEVSALGFPRLEELCMATSSSCPTSDRDLWDLLLASPKLRVLDLRGCFYISAPGLAALPCEELECLFWGQYFNSKCNSWPPPARKDLHKLTEKWSRSLRELDLANQLFSEEDLELALGHLARAPDADTLRSLNLSGTRISAPALRLIIQQSTALNYLNVTSCRNLPRGQKRVHRGHEEISQLLVALQ
ncbi:F-box/LRR-repeat protein 6 [Gadus morhua]|uniref:F-box domain-containing protein n=1 Tax=Gadus morhua TaxID=8049 RepID=A0A8C5FI05_GADMO|nr:F-box/LRR-repeat protein 6 [Gadus morhua]